MKRLIPLVLLVLVAAIAVIAGMGDFSDDGRSLFDPQQLTLIERRIGEGDLAGAQKALENDPSLTDAERLYGLAAVALSEGRLEDALESARGARKTAPKAWRPLSLEFASLSALGRDVEAGLLAHEAVQVAPDDERVLALAAHHFASTEKDPDPHLALELIDRIDALPVRKAAENDPTEIGRASCRERV